MEEIYLEKQFINYKDLVSFIIQILCLIKVRLMFRLLSKNSHVKRKIKNPGKTRKRLYHSKV